MHLSINAKKTFRWGIASGFDEGIIPDAVHGLM